jgi:hypothetical protein
MWETAWESRSLPALLQKARDVFSGLSLFRAATGSTAQFPTPTIGGESRPASRAGERWEASGGEVKMRKGRADRLTCD